MSTFPIPHSAPTHIDLSETSQLRVHSIETFGTHDGPGIRLVIFVQGCQFKCLYCANPDTIDVHGGEIMSVEDIVERALHEKAYFGRKGGVTVSGGEPLLQRKVLRELFVRLHEEGIHTALDSNGRLIDQAARDLLEETDLLLLDVKHIDDDWHHRLTGVSNVNSLKVAAHREATGKPFWLRYVLVPGWSDQDKYLHQLGQHFAEYQHLEKIEIEPYHQLGVHKWEALGCEYKLYDVAPPDAECIQRAVDIFSEYFRTVKVN